MKRIVRIMCVLLASGLVLALSGCKTKEKAIESHEATVRTDSSATKADTWRTGHHEREDTEEQRREASERDSLVEKLHERTVVDARGRVLLKDSEYTKERYQGKCTTKANGKESNHRTATEQKETRSRAKTDTSSTGTGESTRRTVRHTYGWLWPVALFVLLFAGGVIISRTKR